MLVKPLLISLPLSLIFLINSCMVIVSSSADLNEKNSPLKATSSKSASLKSADVSEGECIIDPPIASFINPLMWLRPRTYYIPIASEYAFRRYAETFLGRSAHSEQELEKMCLSLDLFGFSFKTFGYGEYLGQTCYFPSWAFITSLNWGTMKCYADGASNDIVQKSFVDDYTDNLVLTDNDTFAMFARCVNGVKDFKVLTTSPEIGDDLLEKIKEKAISLGFNGKFVRTLQCHKDTKAQTDSNTHQEL